jgi:hypothetical protein
MNESSAREFIDEMLDCHIKPPDYSYKLVCRRGRECAPSKLAIIQKATLEIIFKVTREHDALFCAVGRFRGGFVKNVLVNRLKPLRARSDVAVMANARRNSRSVLGVVRIKRLRNGRLGRRRRQCPHREIGYQKLVKPAACDHAADAKAIRVDDGGAGRHRLDCHSTACEYEITAREFFFHVVRIVSFAQKFAQKSDAASAAAGQLVRQETVSCRRGHRRRPCAADGAGL